MRFAVGVMVLFACGSAHADSTADIKRAIQAANKHDFAGAVKILMPGAEAGDSLVEYYLASLYDGEFGYAPPNPAEALKWMRKAAEKGLKEAQSSLGDKYYDGRGVKQDLTEAAKWFRLSADQGYAAAQGVLGELYETGRGVPEDKREALRLYLLAAAQGRAVDQVNAGHMYATGSGTERDDATAVKYFRLAADQENVSAAVWLSSAYETGSGVGKDLTLAYMWTALAERFAGPSKTGPNLANGFEIITDSLRHQMTPQAIELAQQMAANWKPGDAKANPKN